MKLHQPHASIYVPDGRSPEQALPRVTHLGIGAHPDDLEIMALHGIVACHGSGEKSFGGVVCAHGGEAVREVRRREQEEAARIGNYGVLVQLDYSSAELKSRDVRQLESDLNALFQKMRPQTVYTHQPADRHETHVAVALAVLNVLRRLPAERRPEAVYGGEVWGSLDWLPEAGRVALDVSHGAELSAKLIAAFQSQIGGGKHYDDAVAGRRRANATFTNPYAPDPARELCFAMDLTPLARDPNLDVVDYVSGWMERFKKDTLDRMRRQTRD